MNIAILEPAELKLSLTLTGVIALRMLGLFLVLPVFVLLAADIPGYTPALAGLAMGIYGLTQAILQQPFGWLSDRWGRRPVLLLGMLLFAVGGAVAALSESMGTLIAGRALQGCGAVAGVALAFAADGVHAERRSVAMAVIGIGIGFSFLLSTLLSVPLANLLGLQGLFWLTSVLGLGGMVLVLTAPADIARQKVRQEKRKFSRIWPLAVSVFWLHAAMTLFFVALPGLLVDRYGLALSRHWIVYLPTMLVSALLIFPLLRGLTTRGREAGALPWAFALLGLSLIALSVDIPLEASLVLVSAYFVAFNLLEAALPAQVSRLTGSVERGRTMGAYTTFQFLGAFTGGAAGGWLLGAVGGAFTLMVAGGVCVAWFGAMRAFANGPAPTG